MRKFLSIILTFALMLTVLPFGLFTIPTAAATSGYYTYTITDGKATITKVDNSISGIVTIPSKLGGYTVTSIGDSAFNRCTNLEYVTIPSGVKSIGEYAFYGCKHLYLIDIPNSITSIGRLAFYNTGYYDDKYNWDNGVLYIGNHLIATDNSISADVTVRPGTITIADFAFQDRGGIRNVSLHYGIVTIGWGAFSNCSSLESITLPEFVRTIKKTAFSGCKKLINITIPIGVTNIESSTFSGCCGLKNITILDNVTNIADNAFYDCRSLESIIIPDSVSTIGSFAFKNCSSLKNITIPDNVTNIATSAFDGCSNLANVTIGKGVKSIGGSAFRNCSLESVNFNAESCSSIGSLDYPAFSSKLKEVNIGDSVENIPSYAFYNTSLESIIIPDSVSTIGSFAFENCSSLKNITIPDNVVSIGSDSFYGTEYYTNSYNWDNGVLYIGNHLIKGNNSVSDVYAVKPGTITIAASAFYSCNLKTIIIPKSITNIGYHAFYPYRTIKVFYTGSLTEKNKILNFSGNDKLNWHYNTCEEHKYLGACGTKCSSCDWTRNSVAEHTYSNTCDASCNICFENRTVGPHIYDYDCDTKCNECGVERTHITHTYDNGCDKECNMCGYIRNDITHIYDNACDITCNICHEIRTIAHTYSNADDLTCNVCKESLRPKAPVLESKFADRVSLIKLEGLEYSLDGLIWQESNMFSGLNPNTEYTFYQRVAESENSLVSETSAGLTITTKNRFIVSYDANGGYNAPATQLKDEGVPINISSQRLTRNGYVFVGWGTTEKCGKQYAPGEEYNKDEDITFYALWYDAKDCSNCDAKGEIKISSCYLCNGYGMRDACTKCGSTSVTEYITGYGSIGKRCNSCGTYPTSTTKSVRCSNCSGSGYIYESCEVCNGSCVEIIKQNAPTVVSFTDSVVILMFKEGCEYSKNGTDWQESNIFSDLLPATDYTFYIRQTSTETTPFSPISLGVTIKTDKTKQTLIPNAPTVQSSTATSITLNAVDGCEYSKDGVNWQSSNIFSGLLCGTEYTFYQRYKETATNYVGKSSTVLVTKTDKGTQTAPSAPTLLSKNHNSITLMAVDGYEYSRDGINWQTSNVFTGLTPETNYIFYQRKAETDRYYVGPASNALTVKTLEELLYTPGDIDDVEGVTDADAEYMLMYTFFPEDYPVNQECDFNGDGKVNDADAEHLLMFTFFPEDYPLH